MAKENSVNTVNNIDKNIESVKIISIAAFCFSIVSLITTSKGLKQFVFSNAPDWISVLISFSIQSILFVFNLRFPRIISTIWIELKNKIVGIKRSSLFVIQFIITLLIIMLYSSVLIGSSLFSYIYIYDDSYLSQDVYKVDSEVALSSTYEKSLQKYSEYISENKKLQGVVLYNYISDMAEIIGEGKDNISDISIGFSDSQKQHIDEYKNMSVDRLDSVLNDLNRIIKTAKRNIDYFEENIKYLEESKKNIGYKYHSQYYADLRKIDNEINKLMKQLQEEETKSADAEARKVAVKWCRDIEVNSVNNKKDKIISDLLKLNINSDNLNIDDFEPLIKDIESMVENYIESDEKNSLYGQMVKKLQKINVAKSDYVKLIKSYNLLQKNNNKNWKEKYDNLINCIYTIPSFNESAFENHNVEDIVNVDALKNFQSERDDISSELENLRRLYLSDISEVEKSCALLLKDNRYRFSAFFSLILAIFLDLSSLIVGIYVYIFEMKKKGSAKNEYY